MRYGGAALPSRTSKCLLPSSECKCCLSVLSFQHIPPRTGYTGDAASARRRILQDMCVDLPGDKSGVEWTEGEISCVDFKNEEGYCEAYGDDNNNGEGSANQKCCGCGGGSTGAGSATQAEHSAVSGDCVDLSGDKSGVVWTEGEISCVDFKSNAGYCDAYGDDNNNGERKREDDGNEGESEDCHGQRHDH